MEKEKILQNINNANEFRELRRIAESSGDPEVIDDLFNVKSGGYEVSRYIGPGTEGIASYDIARLLYKATKN